MNCTDLMPRKAATFRIDDRVLESLAVAARKAGRSKNSWLEMHLLNFFKEAGILSPTTEPLSETRGGGRSKKSTQGDNTSGT